MTDLDAALAAAEAGATVAPRDLRPRRVQACTTTRSDTRRATSSSARLGRKLASHEPNVDVYRLGGDEFCLLAPVDGVDIERLVDEAVNALTERGEGFEVTSSFGTVLLPEEATEQSEALRVADARLYAQKHGKRATREQPHRPLLQALLEREPALYAHMEDVAALASAIGTRLGLEQHDLEELHRAALLHDIGKLAVPDAILNK